MISKDEWRRALNAVADAYDGFRPRYPAELPQDVIALAGLKPDARIVEIGCGTGQLTTAFAARDYELVALEPGANLAAHARRNCASYPKVRIEVCKVEDWVPDGQFDLVLSAQSFHLVDPEQRFEVAARLLSPSGALTVVWNYRLPGETEAHRVLQEAYARHAPTLIPDQLYQDTPFEDDIDRSGLFGSVFMCRYRWTQVYTSAEYVGLLRSHATHHLLPEQSRSALFQASGEGLERVGGKIAIDYLTRLYVAVRGADL